MELRPTNFILYLAQAVNCERSCFWRRQSVGFLFVYDNEISRESGTAERIFAKFTQKTCLVPRSGEFEGQGQRSKVKVTKNKNKTAFVSQFGGLRAVYLW